jgi:hypothetical protein
MGGATMNLDGIRKDQLMSDIAAQLSREVRDQLPQLRLLTEAQVTADRGKGKWVRKEILGHLIDSAANNHQRFVRARSGGALVWPGYDQNGWVEIHAYRSRPWAELLDLWAALNTHIAQVITSTPADRLATSCVIGASSEPVTLEWLMKDYITHLRHHLSQLREP